VADILCVVACLQVRKFAYEQYAATGLTMHPLHTPVEVKKQANGKLTIVIADKDGNKTEITDNDQVRYSCWARQMFAGGNCEQRMSQLPAFCW
jgi:hypothetical protein